MSDLQPTAHSLQTLALHGVSVHSDCVLMIKSITRNLFSVTDTRLKYIESQTFPSGKSPVPPQQGRRVDERGRWVEIRILGRRRQGNGLPYLGHVHPYAEDYLPVSLLSDRQHLLSADPC